MIGADSVHGTTEAEVVKLVNGGHGLIRRRVEGVGQKGQLVSPILEHLHSGRAGHRLDASDARCDTALVGDDEGPDIAGRPAVCAATELHRELRHRYDARPVTVLLAEEGHGPRCDGFLG